jgi:hypothetical protein
VTPSDRTPDPSVARALAYLEALAISCQFPHPLPLGGGDAAELRAAAGAMRRLMAESEGRGKES